VNMDYEIEYKEFITWITDLVNCGLAVPVVFTEEEAAFVKLFAAYFNCRYPSKNRGDTGHGSTGDI